MNRIKWALVLVLGLTLFVVPFASAHAFIDHCTPEVGSTVAAPPQQIVCVFTDAIDPKQTVITVTDANNNQVDNKDLKGDRSDTNGMTVIETLNTAKMSGGLYTVKWSTVAQDGHATNGQWQFAVAAQAASTAAQTTSLGATPAPTPTSAPSTTNTAAALPAKIVLASPTDGTTFPDAPSDIVVTVQVSNFQLGQGGKRWQFYLDDQLLLQVTDGSTSATLRAVPAGDHALTVALATDDKTIVATDGAGIGVGPQPGDIPSTALDTTCGWQTLSGGGDAWYKIPYQQGTRLEITLDDYGAGTGFDVWDPARIQTWGRPDQVSPVGSGSPNPDEPAHDLTWAGHLAGNGTYFVHLTNNDTVTDSYRLCSTQR
jgi:methionine-rich copper-binding protein CopC